MGDAVDGSFDKIKVGAEETLTVDGIDVSSGVGMKVGKELIDPEGTRDGVCVGLIVGKLVVEKTLPCASIFFTFVKSTSNQLKSRIFLSLDMQMSLREFMSVRLLLKSVGKID